MRKLLAAASVAIGILLFVVVLLFVGLDSIIEPFRKFSPIYLALFLLTTAVIYLATVLRWAAVLKYQGVKVNFPVLLRYKLISSAISYLTPAARMGGEPVRAFLFKKRTGIKGRQAVSSVILEASLGMSTDALFTSLALIVLLLFFALPGKITGIALLISLATITVIAIYFSTLVRKKGLFSLVFRVAYHFIRKPFLKGIIENISLVENAMSNFLLSKRKGVIEAVSISAITWPLTFLQYKFALLSVGFDASFIIILLSIIATSLAGVIPIPAAFGVQEAGNFSVFSLVAAANVGIALSLLLRLKDLIITFFGVILLSHEGMDMGILLRHKKDL